MGKNNLPKDSGSMREFNTGAHRDASTGKGRCDLLPLRQVAAVMQDPVIAEIAAFMEDHDTSHLAAAVRKSVETVGRFGYDSVKSELEASGVEMPELTGDKARTAASLAYMMIEASHLYEAGAIKYGENNWKRGMPLKCYIDSGTRHYLKTLRGDADEPHYRGFLWNMLGAMWTVANVENAFDGFEVRE